MLTWTKYFSSNHLLSTAPSWATWYAFRSQTSSPHASASAETGLISPYTNENMKRVWSHILYGGKHWRDWLRAFKINTYTNTILDTPRDASRKNSNILLHSNLWSHIPELFPCIPSTKQQFPLSIGH